MLLSKELIVPKKGKQIWPAETRPAVLVLVLRYGALNCAPLRSGPEQELNHSKPVIPASTQFMSFSKFYEFTERMLHQPEKMSKPEYDRHNKNRIHILGLSPGLRQTVKTLLAVL